MLRINRCFWEPWINVEMKYWMMDPPILKTTIQKSHVLDVLCCNHKWVSDYNVFPMWQLVFTVPICQAFERERHILQEVCYSAEMRFFSSLGFSTHWNNYNFSRALMYTFFFSLRIGKAETSLVKREQSGNLSPGVTVVFIYLASTAGYDESSFG